MDKDIVDTLRDSQPIGTVGGLLLNDAANEIKWLRGILCDVFEISEELDAILLLEYHSECSVSKGHGF